MTDELNISMCPLPQSGDEQYITLAYGEGGRLSRRMIYERIVSRFGNEYLHALGDSACLPQVGGRLAFTTDGYTVSPLFFPGGDIGRLAVIGTVNDLAVSGARPLWLSLSLIIEEGLAWATLERVLDSVQQAAAETGVSVVTGDTKIVPRGTADGLFITTAGIGEVLEPAYTGAASIEQGDQVIVSGPVGRHGAAILCAREDFGFRPAPVSDCASLVEPLAALRAAGIIPRAVRDATRGGISAVLHEWTQTARAGIAIDEALFPVADDVHTVCELLGLDWLHMACEGTFVAAVQAADAERAVTVLREHYLTAGAAIVGHATQLGVAPVVVKRAAGRQVPLDEPAGQPLPRIC